MKSFLKILLLIALAANMVFLFVLGGRIPEGIRLPLGLSAPEKEEEEMTAEAPAEPEAPAEQEKGKTKKKKAEEAGTQEAQNERETGQELTKDPAGGTGAEAGTEEMTLPACRIISEGGSNIRSGPGVDFEVVLSYPYDTVLFIRGEVQDGWYPIQAEDGTEGYIFETQIGLPEDYDPSAYGLQAEGQMQ